MEFKIHADGAELEHVSGFKYLGCVLDESGIDVAECRKNGASERKTAGAIRALVNLECPRVLHEALLVPVLMHGTKTMMWREKEITRIRDVIKEGLRGLLGIRKIE